MQPEGLLPRDAERLPLDWRHRLLRGELTSLLTTHADRSAWLPRSGEFSIVAPWRFRPEISQVIELDAPAHPVELIDDVSRRCEAAGDRLILMVEGSIQRPAGLYARCGLGLLEEVISLETTMPVRNLVAGVPVASSLESMDDESLENLLKIDSAAFPWLWRNSAEEFQAYFGTGRVEILTLVIAGEPIGYIGMTVFATWGHIDRLAVLPAWQGRGYGRALLVRGIERLNARGIRQVGLSTQASNMASQGLYSQFGFERNTADDYRIYGRYLNLESLNQFPAGIDQLGEWKSDGQ